jgi:hypothetical protein
LSTNVYSPSTIAALTVLYMDKNWPMVRIWVEFLCGG